MPLTLYKRGHIWHYRGTVAGRRVRGSTKTSDKEVAQRVASRREAQEWKHRIDGPASVLTFAKAASRYLAAGKSDRFLLPVLDYWRDTLVRDINAGAVRRAAIEIYPTHSAATRNRQAIVPTQAVINFAADEELCAHLKVKRFPVVKREKAPATWEWVQAFMAACKQPHLAALGCFLFLTGARISEALQVRWKDVDLGARTVVIRQGKLGGDERIAHMPPELVVAIANIAGREGKVFRYSSYDTAKPMWFAAIKRAGIAPLTFHRCRHGFATGLLHQGVDPVTVAKRGGWKSPAHVFATYGHAMEDVTVTNRLTGTKQTQPSRGKRRKAS